MPILGSWSWKPIAAWAVVVLVAVAIMVATAKQPASPPSQPQPGVVVSYRFQQVGSGPGGGGCAGGGVVATVRLNNGKQVRAASIGPVIIQDGALVTVQRHRPLCGPESYTILHGGTPNNSIQRTPTRYAGRRR